jgi:tetratricopeptide (TPR) repeat protein
VRARLCLGELHHSRGELDAAADAYRAVLEVRPATPRALYGLASIERLQGSLAASLEHFRRALELVDDEASWHHEYGLALLADGREAEALAAFARAAELRPDWSNPWRKSAWILATSANASLRDPALALTQAERAQRLSARPDGFVLDTLAAAQAATGDFEGAVRTQREAVELLEKSGRSGRADELRARLEIYLSGQPFVSPSAAPSAARARPEEGDDS